MKKLGSSNFSYTFYLTKEIMFYFGDVLGKSILFQYLSCHSYRNVKETEKCLSYLYNCGAKEEGNKSNFLKRENVNCCF